MSFVPLSGPATLRAAEPPRDGVVEFTDDRRHGSSPADPGGAAGAGQGPHRRRGPPVGRAARGAPRCSAMRFVAAGKFEPGERRLAARPARRRRHGAAAAAGRVACLRRAAARRRRARRTPPGRRGRRRHAARRARRRRRRAVPAPAPRRAHRAGDRRVQPTSPGARRAPPRRRGRPARSWSTLSLRVEADEEELVAGSVPAGAAGPRRAGPAPRLRRRARCGTTRRRCTASATARAPTPPSPCATPPAAWPPLERLLEQRVPDEMALDDRRAGQPARGRRRGAAGRAASTCSGRAAWAATSRATATLDRVAGRARGAARRGACSAATRCSRSTGRSRCAATR